MDRQKSVKTLNVEQREECCNDMKATESSNPAALPRDTILAGKYAVKDMMGQDSISIIYLAEDDQTGKSFVVKELFPKGMASRCGTSLEVKTKTDEQLEIFCVCMESFLEGAEKIARIQENQHIVGVRQCFRENGTAYVVMDYVQGVDLNTYIERNGGRLSWEESWKIMMSVMETLDALHKKGFSHCDVAPDNIIISNDGTVKLADFGEARPRLAGCGMIDDSVLKPGYAPLEEYLVHGRLGPHTDVYYAAACFYKALSGKVPPSALDRVDDDHIMPLGSCGIKIPENTEKAIMKALSVRAEDRFLTMREFMENLINGVLIVSFLTKPTDGFSAKFFGKDMVQVSNILCRYKMEIYGPAAGKKPYKGKKSKAFKIDDTHIYCRYSSDSWYAVSTLKTPAVKTTPLKNMVLSPYYLSQMTGQPMPFVSIPQDRKIEDYKSMELTCLGSWEEYNRIHCLEETVVYCHIFLLNGEIYKDYILCARKNEYAWKVECYLKAMHADARMFVTDSVPVGYTFGSFFPIGAIHMKDMLVRK